MLKCTCAVGALTAAVLMVAPPAEGGTTNFFANLSGDNEVPPNSSVATGTFSGIYDSITNTFSFEWDIENLLGNPASPGSHIHVGQPDENGPIVFGFNNPDGTWPLTGFAQWNDLTPQNVDDLFAGNLYANFHTDVFEGGEVRGQIIPAPGAAALFGIGGLALTRRRR